MHQARIAQPLDDTATAAIHLLRDLVSHMCMLQVGGALQGFAVERISVGMQHVAAQASPLDKKTGLPQVSAPPSSICL